MDILFREKSTCMNIFKVNKTHRAWLFWPMFAKHKIVLSWPNNETENQQNQKQIQNFKFIETTFNELINSNIMTNWHKNEQ